MPKPSKFKAALLEAEHKLQKAESDLQKYQVKTANLQQQIPKLRNSVEALRQLCGEKSKPSPVRFANVSADPNGLAMMPVIDKNIPESIRKLLPKDDLSGMGSKMPERVVEQGQELAEDELLPEPEGEEIL